MAGRLSRGRCSKRAEKFAEWLREQATPGGLAGSGSVVGGDEGGADPEEEEEDDEDEDEDRLAEEYLMDECEESELPPPPAASSLGAGLMRPTPRQSALGPEAAADIALAFCGLAWLGVN